MNNGIVSGEVGPSVVGAVEADHGESEPIIVVNEVEPSIILDDESEASVVGAVEADHGESEPIIVVNEVEPSIILDDESEASVVGAVEAEPIIVISEAGPSIVYNKYGELNPNQEGDTEPSIIVANEVEEPTINVTDVQSYPSVGENWTVRFNTTGKANLTITAVNGTTWSDENEDNDLKFLEIRRGDELAEYEWINNSVFIEDYECNETGHAVSKVLISGKHTLEFKFGDDVEYAHNDASNWYNPSWNYRKLITIDHTKVDNVDTPSTTYANFPVLIN
ncbi:MAG: hypothetical protein PHY19_06525, partial [Methanocellales archaeon]|nr:hypothetical protein [Methanocellales archaeon]